MNDESETGENEDEEWDPTIVPRDACPYDVDPALHEVLEEDEYGADAGVVADLGGAAALVLSELEQVACRQRMLIADQYRVIGLVICSARVDTTIWLGADPTRAPDFRPRPGWTIGQERRRRVRMAERAAIADIATRLRLTEREVADRAGWAAILTERTPHLWRLFLLGRVDEANAVTAARHAATLPHDAPDTWGAFDRHVIGIATRLPKGKFAASARAARERIHPESVQERHVRAAQDRNVWLDAGVDGMATLTCQLPATDAHAAFRRIDQTARHLRSVEGESRTLAQLRADTFADLLILGDTHGPEGPSVGGSLVGTAAVGAAPVGVVPVGTAPVGTALPPAAGTAPAGTAPAGAAPAGTAPADTAPADTAPAGTAPAGTASVGTAPTDTAPTGAGTARRARVVTASTPASRRRKAQIAITIPALTLLGHSDEPATLDGYGPIPLDTAKEYAAGAASWIRVLTHPVTGAVRDVDTYRVPEALRRWLDVTQSVCIFPGCTRAARDCDIDHKLEWALGGATSDRNLAPECEHHHAIKTESRWSIAMADPDAAEGSEPDSTARDTTRWISPTRKEHDLDPAPF